MSDDIFDVPDDDEVQAPPQDEAKQKREAADIRKRLKEAETLAKEVEELRVFKAEREKADRQNAVTGAFTALGLQPEWTKFFDGEETTEDAVKAWAVSNKFLQPAEDEPAPEPVSTGYTPTVIEGSPIGSKIYSFDEWLKMSETDPAQANQLWKSNRVEGKIT